jgi:class 3 adenylate cyclase
MLEVIQKVREKIHFDELDMRIGIHTGKIIGGIIGTEIVRYDIYGRDVMIANKFE